MDIFPQSFGNVRLVKYPCQKKYPMQMESQAVSFSTGKKILDKRLAYFTVGAKRLARRCFGVLYLACRSGMNPTKTKGHHAMKTAESNRSYLGGQMKTIALILILWCATASADEGIATFYTVKSCQREGTSGVYTANGERYNERALTCALRRRDWGGMYRVTNLANGKSVIVRQNDYGPGKKATKRGVVIDLSPGAFDALGGKRGETWGEIKVSVERIK